MNLIIPVFGSICHLPNLVVIFLSPLRFVATRSFEDVVEG